MASRIPKSSLPRCRSLREQAGLSKNKLAAAADVSRDLVRSLEDGNPHSTHKVRAVFNALQHALGTIRADEEITGETRS